jgi:hypothetical protein
MKTFVDAEWIASWECPKCENHCDQNDYDLDFDDGLECIECKELVDKGGLEFEVCGHEYLLRR